MYHEEKIIKGVLHWRGTPNGEFKPYTVKQLTKLYTEFKARSVKERSALRWIADECRASSLMKILKLAENGLN